MDPHFKITNKIVGDANLMVGNENIEYFLDNILT